MEIQMNISSVIVKVDLNRFEGVLEALKAIPHVEVPVFDRKKGIVIALIEAQSVQEELRANRQIEATPGVISAHMHYSYSEEGPQAQEFQEIAKQIEGEDEPVRYKGDVRNWMD